MWEIRLTNILARVALAIVTLVISLSVLLFSIDAFIATEKPLWMLGAKGFAPVRYGNTFLLSGDAFYTSFSISRVFVLVVPILVLATPDKYFKFFKGILVRFLVFAAVLAVDFFVVAIWFGPYDVQPDIQPIPQASDEIRAGLGPVERLVYGGLLDQAERGASSWIVVVHAAVLTALILIAFEVLRWIFRRLRSSKTENMSEDEIAGSR